jgi:hypothetical protein
MGFAAYWSRASFRRRWRGLAGIALLLGLVGGLSLFALAGARRTQSAYPRFLRSTNPSTMAVVVGGMSGDGRAQAYDALDQIAHLPQVVSARAYVSFYAAPWINGSPDFNANFEAIGSVDGRYFDQDVFTPTKGRRPDPTRSDEVAVNAEAARRYGYHVGQRIDFGTVSQADLDNPAFSENPQPRLLTKATIVGVGAFIEEVMQDDTDRSPLVLFTPAFVNEAKGLENYAWQGLVLRHGDADIVSVEQAIDAKSDPGAPQLYRETSTDVFHAQQAVRPISLALAAFGAIAGVAGLVLVGQALSRSVRVERDQYAVARSMGAGPGAIALASAAGPVLAVVVGSALAMVVATIASPAMPIGPVRQFEVHRGINVDWTVLGLGGATLMLVLSAIAAFVGWRGTPHRVAQRAVPSKPSSVAAVARSSGLPLPLVTGLRLALEPGQGTTAVPVRSVMAGTALALTALIAALTFGASLDHLVARPRLGGWDWDVALVDSQGYGNTNPAATTEILGSDPDVTQWGGAFYGADEFDGVKVPLLGIDPGSPVIPPIRAGRMIVRPGEIVLGTASLAQLHKNVGDTVMSSTGPRRIVGTATFPSIGQVHSDHTSLGVGGIVVSEEVPGYARNTGGAEGAPLPPEYGPNVLFIRFRQGADQRAVIERLNGTAPGLGDSGGITVVPVQRSAEIVNSDNISGSSMLLGIAVAVSALASLAIALTAAVRRRRRDLALLKALGFTRRQLSATVAWQATSTTIVGLLIGVPLGVAFGRVLWVQFAGQLDVLAEPSVPLSAIGVVAVVALVAANILAALPARYARAVPPSLVLRTE